VLDDKGGFSNAIVALSGSQLKKSKKWNSIMSALKIRTSDNKVFTPPTFSHKYKLKTVMEQNDQGSWFGWDVSLDAPLGNDDGFIYSAAKQFSQNINSGSVKASEEEPF
jgi:hypothetical protein